MTQKPERLLRLLPHAWSATPATAARKLSGGRWRSPPHLELLSRALMRAACLPDQRVIVSLPPRHGKSELASHYFPAWYLSQFPERRVLISGYSDDFASTWGAKVRDLVKATPELGRVRPDVSSRGWWQLESGGEMYSVGIGGVLTGRGTNLAIIDDPIKDWETAYSRLKRQRIWDWYRSTLYTRLEPGGSVVLVMTRWHHEDLAGMLLHEASKGGEQWTEIRLPAIAEEGDPLGRPVGAALWPERYNEEALARIQEAAGPLVWAGLYQQRPVPEGAELFDPEAWGRYLFPPPAGSFDRILGSWDLAFKDLKTSDFVVGQVWGFRGAQAFLLEQRRGQWDFDRTVHELREQRKRWPQLAPILVEDKANGPAVVSHLRREIPGLLAITPEGSKEARAAAVQPFQAAGNVFLPHPDRVPWVPGFVLECQQFPLGSNDDQVDAFSQALAYQWLRGGGPAGKIEIPGLDLPSRWSV